MTESEHDTPPTPADLSPREVAAYEAILAHVLAALVAKHSVKKRTAARPLFTRPAQTEVPELGGVALGTVKLKKGAESYGTAGDAWLNYVRDQFPEHIVTTEAVADSFTAAAKAKHKAGAEWVDFDENGEERRRKLGPASRLPGITYSGGDPTLEIKPDWEAATAAVLAALGDNAALFGLDPKELEQ